MNGQLNYKMKIMKLKSIFASLVMAAALFSSCDRDVNDWEVATGENRLFKPLIFEASTLKPTSIQIKHTKVVDAASYLFEFSKDAGFATIDKQIVILADTLTPFADSNTAMKVEYRTWFEGFDGTTNYWVRMHAENKDATLKSKLSSFEFVTPAEQIFRGSRPTVNSLTMLWEPTDRVTHLVLMDTDSVAIETHELTATEIQNASATFENLEMGTPYIVQIFYNEVLRGTLNAKTSGFIGSVVLNVTAPITVEALNSFLVRQVGEGFKKATINFKAGMEWDMGGTITIPTGIEDISFVGSEDASGKLSQLNKVYFAIESEVKDVNFEYLSMNSDGGFMFQVGAEKFHNINFEGCEVSKINSAVRLHSGAVGNSINFNNCRVSNTGGWSFLNVGSGCTIPSINVTNSTLTEFNTRIADIRVKTDIVFKNVTMVNIAEKMTHLWLLDNNSRPTLTIENCIFAGPNGGQKLHSTNGNYGNVSITYGGSYKTNDLVEDSRPLTDITTVNLDVYGLFVDPANGDFHIKPGAGFAGTGVAGDPRWF